MAIFKDFDSWFEEVKAVGLDHDRVVGNAADFEEYYKQGISPDTAFFQWIYDGGK